MTEKVILIVDDNAANLKLARVVLAAEGFDVHTANDAEEALQVLPTIAARLVLMDIQLPDMDGLELTRRLKADPRYRDLIIVALTAYAMKGDEEKARNAGCDGYVTKPIDPATLPGIVSGFLD
jgi:two-component system, cell cycle response regulator DivK